MIRPDLAPWLRALDSASICDACKRLGIHQRFMDREIKPVWPGARTVGPAYTVRLVPGQGGCGAAIRAAKPGDVLVVDARGRIDAIVWGEMFSGDAATRKLAGAVFDGAVRDIEGIASLAFPVFARSVVPGTARWPGDGSHQVPVTVGRVRVHPGDIIFADEIGIAVVAAEHWQAVAEEALSIQQREGAKLELYLQGYTSEQIQQMQQGE